MDRATAAGKVAVMGIMIFIGIYVILSIYCKWEYEHRSRGETMEQRIHHAIRTAIAELPYNTPVNDLCDAVIIQVGITDFEANKWQIRHQIKRLRHG